MAGRVMDGRALWHSQKIASLPDDVRAEYPWLHPLAGSNGVFENDPRAIWAECYAYSRPNVKPEDVERFLDELIKVKLLFPYEANGKRWCYWTGSEKLGRLPRPSHQKRDSERGRNGPDPPNEKLVEFMADSGPARHDRVTGTAIACREHASDVLGLGSGLGSGSGECASHTPTPSAPGVCERAVAIWNEHRGPLPEAQKLTQGRRRKILARLKNNPQFLDVLDAATRKAAETPFLRGEGSRGWKADLDWMIANDEHATRVLEGTYDGPAAGKGDANGRFERNCQTLGISVN